MQLNDKVLKGMLGDSTIAKHLFIVFQVLAACACSQGKRLEGDAVERQDTYDDDGSSDEEYVDEPLGSKPYWSRVFEIQEETLNAGNSIFQVSESRLMALMNEGYYIDYENVVNILGLDTWGNLLWRKTYQGNTEPYYSLVQELTGGRFFATLEDLENRFILIELDHSGNVLWTAGYELEQGEFYLSNIMKTTDDNFIIAGAWTNTEEPAASDILVLKINEDRNVAWSYLYRGEWSDGSADVKAAWDGGYIVAGYTQSSREHHDILLMKLDDSGNLVWQKVAGTGMSNSAHHVFQCCGDGYSVFGTTDDTEDEKYGILVMTVNNGGAVTLQKAVCAERNLTPCSVRPTSDGGYVLAGWSYSITGPGNGFVVRLNEFMETVWSKKYAIAYHTLLNVQETPDGGFLFGGGMYQSFDEGFYPDGLWVLRTNATGMISYSCPPGIGEDIVFTEIETSLAISDASLVRVEMNIVPVPVDLTVQDASISDMDVTTQCTGR